MSRAAQGPEPALLIHENVTLLELEGAEHLAELRHVPAFRAALVRVLDPCTVVLDARRVPALLEALERHGQRPRVVDAVRGE
jgi:hypothetical protein